MVTLADIEQQVAVRSVVHGVLQRGGAHGVLGGETNNSRTRTARCLKWLDPSWLRRPRAPKPVRFTNT